MPLLEVKNIRKVYRSRGAETVAVEDVSFSIEPGECFGLLGPNGAGKSTTIHCITGFFPPTSGTVTIQGINVHERPRDARRLLGVCPQEDTLDSDFTVLDQLIRHATYFKIPITEGRKRAERLLVQFGLSEKAKSLIPELSGGQRRRLQVARSLVSDPRLLILDEPTTGLDPEARRILWDAIVKFQTEGRSVLLCTHYMDEAERLSDRIGIVNQGRILALAPPKELIQTYIGSETLREEVRPGIFWERPPNLEDVFLKLGGTRLSEKPARA